MIFTPELLEQLNPCKEGLDAATDLGLVGMDGKQAIKALKEHGHTDYAIWVRAMYQNSEAIKLAKFDKKTRYLVYDPFEHIYRSTATLDRAYQIIENIKETNPDGDFSQITLQEEITTLDDQVHRFPIR